MKFEELEVEGAYVIEPEPRTDERGAFARVFCAEEFAARGLRATLVQTNLSTNVATGTLRGLHLQVAPAEEAKLVRCIRGAAFDAIVDLRPGSPTYRRAAGVELSAANRLATYVPEGCAHGYLALEDGTEVLYSTTAPYAPDCERGVRFDDPALALRWPIPVTSVSDKDRTWPLLEVP